MVALGCLFHNFYNGREYICAYWHGWHADLLRRMRVTIPGGRHVFHDA